MNFAVPAPDGWFRQLVAGGEMLRAPDGSLELLVLAIEGAKLEPVKWLLKALVYGGAPRPSIEWNVREPTDVVHGQITTAGAWRAVTVDAKVGDDYRFVAHFSFLDLSATVIASSRIPVSEWRELVVDLLYHSGPDFTPDRITCLAELLDGAPPLTRRPMELPARTWRRAFSAGDLVLIPRVDPDSGWIRQTVGLSPLRSVPELFSELGDTPELRITDEGEYCAIGSGLRGNAYGTQAIVFGAESYTRIESLTSEREHADMFAQAVEALAYQATLGYGTRRIRPYYYQPPAQWSALARPHQTVWVSPLCARLYHVLRVFEACPPDKEEIVRRRRFETVAPEFLVTPPRGPATYYRTDDREVRVFSYSGKYGGAELRILDAAVLDAEYCYPFRIECDPSLFEVSMTLLEQVVQTIVPLPGLPEAPPRPTAHEAFAEWAE